MVDLALIIVNSKYKSKILNDLPKVTDEAVMMKEMLTSHDYEIELYQDVEDICERLEKFQRNVDGREIGRLHFHFSGHGVHNAKIHRESDELDRMRGGRQSDTKTPDVGECLVGTAGELYSVHDLKRELLECRSNKITITLDSSRVQTRQKLRGPETKQVVKLREIQAFKIAEQERIAVISGFLDPHATDDNRSLTRELYEVTDAGKTPILLPDIAKKVNASWKEKGSKINLLEDGENWTDYMWPSDKTQSESQRLNSLIEIFDSLPLDGEIQCDATPKLSRASAYHQTKVQQTQRLSLKQGMEFCKPQSMSAEDVGMFKDQHDIGIQ